MCLLVWIAFFDAVSAVADVVSAVFIQHVKCLFLWFAVCVGLYVFVVAGWGAFWIVVAFYCSSCSGGGVLGRACSVFIVWRCGGDCCGCACIHVHMHEVVHVRMRIRIPLLNAKQI